jgi:hypothetical protein
MFEADAMIKNNMNFSMLLEFIPFMSPCDLVA